MEFKLDPEEIRLRVGLEIHQQLATNSKLFCSCPIKKSERFDQRFMRRLRPAQSELGQIDPAALFEFTKGKANIYLWNRESSCLVELDEEPPHPMNDEAIDIAILIAEMLNSNIVDEIHVMRKIVIDGSNTTGFQRTAVIALGGKIDVDGNEVRVQTVTLEEDAARIIGEDDRARYFALDRLGVPLIEIALEPITGTPEYVEKVALYLGRTLRSTNKVARGLGTIRQDLNLSIMDGSIVEVKGIQRLNTISKVVHYEAKRQMGMIEIAEKLKERGTNKIDFNCIDVTSLLTNTRASILQKALKRKERIICIAVKGFNGIFGFEPYDGIRLGKEIAEIARASSIGGIIHSDEFQRFNMSDEDRLLRKELGLSSDDGIILFASPRALVKSISDLIIKRLNEALIGVPPETRAATEDGETRYMRPRPGSARMYPETDIPEIVITEERKRKIATNIPKTWQDKVKDYQTNYSLSNELALKLYDSDNSTLFERLCNELRLEPSVIGSFLVELPVRLYREGISEERIDQSILEVLLREIDSGRVAKEAAIDILRLIGKGEAKSVGDAIQKLRLEPISEKELDQIISEVISSNLELISKRGLDAFSPLMGEVMKRVRGRIDGQLVSSALMRRLKAEIKVG